MSEYQLTISEDEAVVLFEFFERFDDTEELYFVHPAEYVALKRLSGQIDKATAAMFAPNYLEVLDSARERLADGYESAFPPLRPENRS
jgi:hypothetical protein